MLMFMRSLYKIRSPAFEENRHRRVTKALAEGLGNITEKKLPDWACGGVRKADSISFDVIVNYKNPSGNNYNDWCKHIEKLKQIARKNSLTFYSTSDYAALRNESGEEVLLITYSPYSHTPDMVVTSLGRLNLTDECMQDFKKAR